MAFALPLAMVATAIGAGVSMYGQYQSGQAAAAGYSQQADTASKIAAAEKQAASVTQYAGGRAAEQVGLQSRAAVGRQGVEYAAGNIGGGSPSQVRASQIALGVQSARETQAKYGEVAFQERLTGAEKQATAGLYGAAAAEAPIAADISMAGTGVSAIGEEAGMTLQAQRYASLTSTSGSVSPKWYGG